jgi:hypothetical protein
MLLRCRGDHRVRYFQDITISHTTTSKHLQLESGSGGGRADVARRNSEARVIACITSIGVPS